LSRVRPTSASIALLSTASACMRAPFAIAEIDALQ
jgi:hypothetical protein